MSFSHGYLLIIIQVGAVICLHVLSTFSKAFDDASYWKLFSQLISDSIEPAVVALLAHWYSLVISLFMFCGMVLCRRRLALAMAHVRGDYCRQYCMFN